MQVDDRIAAPPGWISGRFRASISVVAAPFTGPAEVPLVLVLAVIGLVMASGLLAFDTGSLVAGGGGDQIDRPAAIGAGSLVASPVRLEFEQPAGTGTPARNIEVTNLGSRRIDLAEVAALSSGGTRSDAYRIDTDACRDGIPAKGTCVLRVEFVPRTAGNHPATLTVGAGNRSPLEILLQARAT